MTQKRKPEPKRRRVNMRIPTDLLAWVKDYASRCDTTVTHLFVSHIQQLKNVEEKTP